MGWISPGCKTILGRLQRGREMFIFGKDDDERRDDFGEVLGSGGAVIRGRSIVSALLLLVKKKGLRERVLAERREL